MTGVESSEHADYRFERKFLIAWRSRREVEFVVRRHPQLRILYFDSSSGVTSSLNESK